MPRISIIVPVYNVEQYLDECVESLRKQTLKDIEIILVDDESPDNCPIMCDDWVKKDSRIKVIHKNNEGLGLARNSGLEVATGEYVTFVDSDDYVAFDTYQFLLDKYDCNWPDVIYYQFTKFKDGTHVSPLYSDAEVIRINDIKGLQLDIIAAESKSRDERTIKCSACTSIYRRETIEKNHIRFHSERELVSEDMIFNLDFLNVADVACVDMSSLYFYRENPLSLTHTVDENKLLRFDQFDVYLRDNSMRWKLPHEAQERISRLLIGTYRATIVSFMTSPCTRKEKRRLFKISTNSKQLRIAVLAYPWWCYSLYRMLFYLSIRYKLFALSYGLAKIRSMKGC